MDDLFSDALRRLLADRCTPEVVRKLERGAPSDGLWNELEASGFPNALLPEPLGGAGLSLAQAFPLFELCGAHALPVPLAETMVARALLATQDLPTPAGALTLDAAAALLRERGRKHPSPVLLLQACVCSALIAGALQSTLQMTLQYANERSQFGRPIAKFQAIQQQLSVMAEHVFAARMAAQLACAGEVASVSPHAVAVAKARTSEAAHEVAALAHAVHGAIGFTEEYDLQLYTRRLHAWRRTAGSEGYWQDVLGAAAIDHPGPSLHLVHQITEGLGEPA